MKTEIIKDLAQGSLQVKREFNADISLVWRAWTEAELLDQWWAPRPWKCETRHMDFRAGGKWIYEMVGPNGERHSGVQLFDAISREESYSGKDAFADAEGNINEDLPVATWKNRFTPTANGTLVITEARYPNPEALQTVLDMGMEEGIKMAQDGLDELLAELKKIEVAS